MIRLLVAGVALSVLSLAVGGRFGPADLESLLAALREQTPVSLVEAGDFDPEWFVVDGRSPEAYEQGRPAGSLSIPFSLRNRELFPVPDGRPVRIVIVVLDAGESARARELALWVSRQWGVERVATLTGGWPAWEAAGLPIEVGP